MQFVVDDDISFDEINDLQVPDYKKKLTFGKPQKLLAAFKGFKTRRVLNQIEEK